MRHLKAASWISISMIGLFRNLQLLMKADVERISHVENMNGDEDGSFRSKMILLALKQLPIIIE
ncbi:hypothetical protein YDYSY3_39400 [Paenibacillus chitinolyticus]|nr:hypothetical protein YDYSY3_39400 [Paenibacillus chitinolyticus]